MGKNETWLPIATGDDFANDVSTVRLTGSFFPLAQYCTPVRPVA